MEAIVFFVAGAFGIGGYIVGRLHSPWFYPTEVDPDPLPIPEPQHDNVIPLRKAA